VPERQQNQYPFFFFSSFLVSVFFVSVLVPLAVGTVAVVAVVPVVPDVSDMVVPVVEVVPDVPDMVVLVVAVVADVAVSVAIVEDVVVDVMPVSVAAVSVLAFSCFLQPTAKIATATSAMMVITRDFFIGKFSSKFC
jgi:hypothetical protein